MERPRAGDEKSPFFCDYSTHRARMQVYY